MVTGIVTLGVMNWTREEAIFAVSSGITSSILAFAFPKNPSLIHLTNMLTNLFRCLPSQPLRLIDVLLLGPSLAPVNVSVKPCCALLPRRWPGALPYLLLRLLGTHLTESAPQPVKMVIGELETSMWPFLDLIKMCP